MAQKAECPHTRTTDGAGQGFYDMSDRPCLTRCPREVRHVARYVSFILSIHFFNRLEDITVEAIFPFWLIPFGMMGLPFFWALFELLSTPKVDRSALRMRDLRETSRAA